MNLIKLSDRAKPASPFEGFWQAYPRRIGKGTARTAFAKALTLSDAETIVSAARLYASFCKETGIEQQYIPHPSTWLNGERWEDDLESEKPQTTGWGGVLDDL